mmetsp:Transcript_142886/g.356071  ORF Transcript_142886/g.356071 Transcript_142886/m.356071 type:complete len:252 (-) Transcript_142886:10-765(-)
MCQLRRHGVHEVLARGDKVQGREREGVSFADRPLEACLQAQPELGIQTARGCELWIEGVGPAYEVFGIFTKSLAHREEVGGERPRTRDRVQRYAGDAEHLGCHARFPVDKRAIDDCIGLNGPEEPQSAWQLLLHDRVFHHLRSLQKTPLQAMLFEQIHEIANGSDIWVGHELRQMLFHRVVLRAGTLDDPAHHRRGQVVHFVPSFSQEPRDRKRRVHVTGGRGEDKDERLGRCHGAERCEWGFGDKGRVTV